MGKPQDYADILNGVMWFQVGLSGIFIALRIYTRQFIIQNFGWDDILMVVNMVSLSSLDTRDLMLTFFRRHWLPM